MTDPNTVINNVPPADGGQRLTVEQADAIAKSLFGPTCRRVNILVQSLINATTSVDMGLWVPLSAVERTLIDVRWDPAGWPRQPRYLALVELVLHQFAENVGLHREAVEAAHAAGAPIPAWPEWTTDDTLAAYDDILARYPEPPAPAPPIGGSDAAAQPVDPAAPPAPPAEHYPWAIGQIVTVEGLTHPQKIVRMDLTERTALVVKASSEKQPVWVEFDRIAAEPPGPPADPYRDTWPSDPRD